MKLVYKTESPLSVIVLTLSIILWLALIVGTFGIALVYVLFFFIGYLFAHSAYISHIRGTGTRITPEQFPDLYAQLDGACKKLRVGKMPDAYIVNSNGVLNAVATRFLGHNLLVLNSDIVDALEERPSALSFYIGHELGHILRNHLAMAPVMMFGRMFPLIGFAYGRAKEYTCDLHGLACCENLDDAQRALLVLSVGGRRWKQLNLAAYAGQLQATAGFWMSFHEIVGDYPWLVKRVEHVTAVSQDRDYRPPRRNPFAWVIGLFVPRFPGVGGTSLGGLMVVVAIIGILAAIAIPAYQDFLARSQAVEAVTLAENGKTALMQYYTRNGAWPKDLGSAYPAAASSGMGRYTDTVVLIGPSGSTLGVFATMKSAGVNAEIAGKTIEVWTTDNGSTWHCGPGDSNPVDPKYLIASCRETDAP